jgi:hypothetical protein
MTDSPVSGERFGDALAKALGTGPGRSTLAAQKTRVLALTTTLGPRRTRRTTWLAGGLAAAATLTVAGVFFLRTLSPGTTLEARIGDQPVAEHAELRAQETPKTLVFSDGSEIALTRGASAVIASISRERADLRLREGRIVASIRKHTGTNWTIAAGPYAVRVVGTRFSVDWTPLTQTVKVEVTEGRVRVSGLDLPADGVALDAGTRLERRANRDARGGSSTGDGEHSGAQPSGTRNEPLAPPAEPGAGTVGVPSRAASAPVTAASPPAFLALAAKGKYREALEAAEKQGFSGLAQTLPENELVTLANSARFAGNSALAKAALNALRKRFAGRAGAELAALYLARVAEDLDRQPREAARWLRVFLLESPSGDLAASARANLMTILLSAGDRAGARAVAADYVRYHPAGPHLATARSILADPASKP